MTTASMKFTDDFVVEALRRFRRQHRTRRPLIILKLCMALALAALAVIGFIHGPLGLGLLFVGLVALLLFGHHLDFWWLKRSLRKWAFRDEAVVVDFTDEGFHAKSPKQETMLQWSSFTKAVLFRDGFLLFHGPSSFHWIPAASFDCPTDFATVETLLRNKVAEHKVVD